MRLNLPNLFRNLNRQGREAEPLPSLRELKAAKVLGSSRRLTDERNAEAARRLEAAMDDGGLAKS